MPTSSQVFDVRALGAVGDGLTSNTEIFRAVCQSCAEAGGGTVVVGAGRYVTGPFELFSNTELRLEAGAEVLASTEIDDYFVDHNSMESPRIGLIYARDAENITLTGPGTLDFRGPAFMEMETITPWVDFDRDYTRQGQSYMRQIEGLGDGPVKVLDRPGNSLQFLGCRNVSLNRLTLKNAPNWTLHFGHCQDVFVQGLRVLNNLWIANSDGLHCTSCRNVHISDCHIESGDDSIAITTLDSSCQPCENVTVSNCTLVSRSAGVRVGYGYAKSDIRNCLFQNLTIRANRGIGIFARNECHITDISFQQINIQTRLHAGQWWGHGEPIHISAVQMTEDLAAGSIKNVSFRDVTARSETGILIYAVEPGIIEEIRLLDVRLTLTASLLGAAYAGNFDLRPALAPRQRLFQHAEGGLYALNVAYLKVRDLWLSWAGQPSEVFAYGIQTENCPHLSIQGFECPSDQVLPALRTFNALSTS